MYRKFVISPLRLTPRGQLCGRSRCRYCRRSLSLRKCVCAFFCCFFLVNLALGGRERYALEGIRPTTHVRDDNLTPQWRRNGECPSVIVHSIFIYCIVYDFCGNILCHMFCGYRIHCLSNLNRVERSGALISSLACPVLRPARDVNCPADRLRISAVFTFLRSVSSGLRERVIRMVAGIGE